MQASGTRSLAGKIGVRLVLLGLLTFLVGRLFQLQILGHEVVREPG